MITDKGNLYFLTLNTAQSKISKWQKQSLGTYNTVDGQGNQVTLNRKPSSICCNEYNVLVGYYHI